MTCQFRKSRAGTSLGAITPWVLAIACVAMSGRIARADPPSISNLATKTSLSSEEKARITTYGKEWGARLLQIAHGEETDDDVRRVRGKLIEPLQIGNTSAVFLNAYDTALRGPLTAVLDAGDPITGVNALIITSELGTTSAFTTLIDNVGRRQPDRHLRLTAARGVRRLLESGRLTRPGNAGGAANTILGGARNLKLAATQE